MGLIRLWLFIAVPVTATMLLVDWNVAVALIGGPCVAAVAVLVTRRGSTSQALAGLDRRQRAVVSGALRSGAPVTDPELANRLSAYAYALLHERESARTARIGGVALLCVSIGVQLVCWASDVTTGWTAAILLTSSALGLLVILVESRYLERVRRSLHATESHWGIARRA